MVSFILIVSIFLNLVFSVNDMDMQFQITDKTFAYYMNSKLFQNLKQQLSIPAMYVYDYGFIIGNLNRIGSTASDGDLGIKITKKDGNTVESQARCTETAYITEGYGYVLLCNAMQEFNTLTINPNEDDDTIEIPLSDIVPFRDHPFKIIDDDDMNELAESVKLNGVINPAIVRESSDGKYELVSGHRRKRACEIAGLKTLRCRPVDLTDDEATVYMVDSNLQRTTILPSEKAFSYKMRLEAIKRIKESGQGKSSAILANEVGESREQIRRYIRLTALIEPLRDYVDGGTLKLRAAVILSYLNHDQQELLYDYISYEELFPTEKQSEELRGLAGINNLNRETIAAVLKNKPPKNEQIKISFETAKQYFPRNYTAEQIRDEILQYLKRRAKVSGINTESEPK